MKVYLLDDDIDHNFLNTLLLNSLGIMNVEAGTSMEEALSYLNNCVLAGTMPDFIFVDLNMPGINGFAFIKNFEENYWKLNRKSHIIMLTNSILETEREEALKFHSVLDFWSKPLTQSKLRELLIECNHSSN